MDNTWYVGLSDEELSKQIGMSVQTIKKYNKLIEMNKMYVDLIEKSKAVLDR